mgnify:FL=1
MNYSTNDAKMKKSLITIVLLIIISTTFYTCKKADEIVDPGPQFSMDKFEQNIIDGINAGGDSPVAWGYTISQNGTLERSEAFGDARTADDGQMDFTVNKEINVASISKFYTAIAAMQLLDANNLTIDSLIGRWLPQSWSRGPGVNNLTFKDLLKHRSGLESINSNFDSTLSYEGLRSCIQTGVVNPKNRQYLNVNFALFRVLIPSLWSALPDSPSIDIESDGNTQFMYLLYLQENIFDRLDLPLVGCFPEDRQTSTLYYNVNDPAGNVSGTYYNDWNPICGGGGYFMTLMEMAKVNAYFEHTEVLVTEEQREVIKNHRLGLDLGFSSLETYGKYYGKNGSIVNGIGQGVYGQIAIFPYNGIDCVVIMNTQGVTLEGTDFIGEMIYRAYNDAWE